MAPLTRARAAAEAPSLLDTLARAPAAAALVVAALERAEDRKALRLAHPQLRDAVGEATTKLGINRHAFARARPPTPCRWPRLEKLTFGWPDLAAIEALHSETWGALHTLTLQYFSTGGLDAPAARALAAALRRMPALRALELRSVELSDAAAEELFRSCSAGAAPQLRSLTVVEATLTPATARALAATGWRLEELHLSESGYLGAAGVAAIAAAPTFAIRRLSLRECGLDAAAALALASAPWPLEELDLSGNDFRAAGPALGALSRLPRLRSLSVDFCHVSAAGFKALVEAAWPALTAFAFDARVEFAGLDTLGAAAFAGFPALEELDLSRVALGAAGARLLASRR